MKKLFQNKTLWLTLAILLVVAGSIFAISMLGANNTATNPNPATQTIAENTVPTVPEPATATLTEPEPATEPEPPAPPVVLPPNITELLRGVSLSATEDSGYGISTKSEFLLSGLEELEELTAITLQRYITVEPDYEFELLKNEEGGFVLALESELPQNEVLNIKLVDENGTPIKSWAFQTESDLKVNSAFPANGFSELNGGIEITFNTRNIALEDFKNSFSIFPAVEGSFTQNGRSFIFFPTKEYKPSTTYTVTIAEGLTSQNGQSLKEDYEFQFRSYPSDTDYWYDFSLMDYNAETFLPEEVPLISVFSNYNNYAEIDFTLTVYRLDSAEQYLDALSESMDDVFGNYGCDTTKLGKSFAQYTLQLYQPQNAYWNSYLILPDVLPKGYYVIDIAAPYLDKDKNPLAEICHQQKFIQISDLSVGIQKSGEEILFWLNNTASGEAVNNAKITLTNGTETVYAQSDKNGAALTSFPMTDGKEVSYFHDNLNMKIEHAGGVYADVLGLYGYANMHDYDYYTYLYTDRAIYHNSDTINLFGFIAPRQKAQLPEELYLVMRINEGEMQRHAITPDKLGGFTMKLEFEDYLSDSSCYVELTDGNGIVYKSQYIYISEYENPVYVIESSFDKMFYEVNDSTEGVLTIRGSFFDGTPAADLSLRVSLYDRNNIEFDPYVVLDEKGEAKIPFRIRNVDSTLYGDGTGNLYFDIFNADDNFEESIYHYGSVPVFYRNVLVRAESQENSIVLHTNMLDTSGIESTNDAWSSEKYTGEPIDIPVDMSWTKIYYTKHEDGSYYDYIQKETVTRYTYIRHQEIVDSFTITSENGIIVLDNLREKFNDENAYYTLDFYFNDTNGYRSRSSISWGNTYFDYSYNSYFRSFTFRNLDAVGNEIYNYGDFSDDEDIRLRLSESSQEVAEGRYLAVQKADRFGEYSVQAADEIYVSEYHEDLIPFYYLSGLYFDGRHIYPINLYSFHYDSVKRELQLEVETDKESYSAGEDITVTVSVKDKDGNAAADTEVLLSLVDEAAFAVQDQVVDILNNIYAQRYRNYVDSYVSHIQHNLDGDDQGIAEEGGEGASEYIRSDFVDTAYFATLITNSEGKAEFKFSMPDNLTTWRITAQGFNAQMHAGDIVAQTVVTQDFFINPVFSNTYLAGDEAYISLRCFGTAISGEENVQYTVILAHDGIEQSFTAEGLAHDYTFLKLGKLEAGSYTVTFKASCGEYSDALQKPIDCINSGISTNIAESFNLADGVNISPERYPVLLSFSNGSFKEYNEVLGWLLNNSNNKRAEQALTRSFVLDALGAEDYFGNTDASWVQPYGNGLVLFDNDSSNYDIALSALTALALPEYINQEGLTRYLYEVVDDYNSPAANVAAAYMGLAALGEPVLLDIRYMLAGDWFEYDEALYLLLGLALLGDEEKVAPLYESVISSQMQIEKNIITGDMAWLGDETADEYEIQYRTAFALAIATASGKYEDAAMFAEFLQQQEPDRYLYLLQLVYYAKNIMPAETEPAAFSYMAEGKTEVIELGMTDKFSLWFSKEQLEKANFKVLQGDVYCTAFYEGSAALLDDSSRELAALEKKITPVKGDGGPGTVYLVTISVKFDKTAPYGGYTIEDYIPSGCRFVKVDRNYTDNWYCVDQSLQDISFYYSYPDPNALSIYGNSASMTTVRYYIRSLLPGNYISDSALISDFSVGVWGKSAKGMLNIGE